jgi:surface protein
MSNFLCNFNFRKFKCSNENIKERVCEYLNGNPKGYPCIGTWDVKDVFNMTGLFAGQTSFNEPLNNWDVGNVTYMDYMFLGASSFNQPLNKWNVCNVKSTNNMFNSAFSFNQDISKWKLTTYNDIDKNMFLDCPINEHFKPLKYQKHQKNVYNKELVLKSTPIMNDNSTIVVGGLTLRIIPDKSDVLRFPFVTRVIPS